MVVAGQDLDVVGALDGGQQLHEVGEPQVGPLRQGVRERSGGSQPDAVGPGELIGAQTEQVGQSVRLAVGEDLDVLVGHSGAEGGHQVAAALDEGAQVGDGLLGRDVQGRGEQDVIAGQALGRGVGGHDVSLEVGLEQGVVDQAEDVVVVGAAPADLAREPGVDGEPLQGRVGLVGDHDGDLVALGQARQRRGVLLDLRAEASGLQVGGVGGVVLGDQALPVGLEGVVDRAPVPVHDSHGTRGQVGVGLQAQLAGVGQPAHLPLGLGLQDQVGGAVLEGAVDVPTKGDLLAGELVLSGVVDVHPGQGDGLGRLEVVDGGLDPEGVAAPLVVEVLGDELVLAAVLVHDSALPQEEVGDQRAAEEVEGGGQRAVDRLGEVRELLPGVDPVGPVVQAVGGIEGVKVPVKALLEPVDEGTLDVRVVGVVVLGLVVQLEADDVVPRGGVGHERADGLLAVVAVGRGGDVHVLARAVLVRGPMGVDAHDLGVTGGEPGGYRGGGGADDDVQAVGGRGIDRTVDVGEVEDAGGGVPGAPGELGDADGGEAGLDHHLHVALEAVLACRGRGVLVVVGRAEQETVRGARHRACHGDFLRRPRRLSSSY